MDKETLLKGIQSIIGSPDADGNYGETGISGRTLDAYIDGILPTLGEDAGEDALKAHAGILRSIGGQIRHEKAEFAKNYKPEGNQVTPPEKKEEGGSGEILAALRQIEADNKALRERLDRQESEAAQRELKGKVLAGMRAKNATDEYVLMNAMRGVELDAKKSVEELVEAGLKLYDAEYTAARGAGASPRQGGGGSGSGDIDGFFEEMKKRGKF